MHVSLFLCAVSPVFARRSFTWSLAWKQCVRDTTLTHTNVCYLPWNCSLFRTQLPVLLRHTCCAKNRGVCEQLLCKCQGCVQQILFFLPLAYCKRNWNGFVWHSGADARHSLAVRLTSGLDTWIQSDSIISLLLHSLLFFPTKIPLHALPCSCYCVFATNLNVEFAALWLKPKRFLGWYLMKHNNIQTFC